MKSRCWCCLGLVIAILATSGCANLNSSLSTEQRPSEISFDKYGFEKYLTEQERAEWQQMLLSAIKADCKPPYGTLAPATGWPTNRIRISAQSHYNLTEEERANVIGIMSFNPSYSYDTASYTPANSEDDFMRLIKLAYNTASHTPAYSEMTYIFLPGYMYACWYPGYPNENTVQPIPYSALLKESTWLVWGNPGGVDNKLIRAFSLSEGTLGYGSDRTLKNLENIYRVNQEVVSKKNIQAKAAEEQAVKAAEEQAVKATEQAVAKKAAELETKAKAILQKNQQANQKNISLKGIFVGMPIDEAKTLANYYFSQGEPEEEIAAGQSKTDEEKLTELVDLMKSHWAMKQKDGRLSMLEMDSSYTHIFFAAKISGEELVQQLVDKYGITMEVDAYRKSWQYRDTKKGIKIQIGGDGSVRMEQIEALIE